MRRAAILLCLVAPVALAACGRDPAPGSVTTSEAKALDDAAAMIDARRLPDDALRPSAAQLRPPSQPLPTPASGAPAK